jgi:putative ABC transport system permease protein
MTSLILKNNSDRRISKVDIIDQAEEEYENGVIVPYILKAANGYHTGDVLRFHVDSKTEEFRIAGFYEDVMFANPTNLMLYKMYVNEQEFDRLESDLGGTKCSVQVAILKNVHQAEDYENALLAKIKTDMKDPGRVYLTSNYLTLKEGTSVFILIIMSVLVAFSGIILTISLIVIRFSTTTHIENSMKNIGAMEAAGYTPNQLIGAILLEYGFVAMVGILLGIVTSVLVTPALTEIISSSIGLRWLAESNMWVMGLTFILVILATLTISYLSAVRIRKITPLIALRSGIETHNFKRNHIPLEKTKWNIHVAISWKELFYHKKQNIVIGIIILMLSMMCVFSSSMYYNFVVDGSAMRKLIGIENGQVEIRMPNDTDRIYNEIKNMPEVRKTVMLEGIDIVIRFDGKEVNPHFLITDDFSQLQIKTCVKGRMPEHDNEISISKLVKEELGSDIGDTIKVEYNNQSKEYLVVGITQHFSYMGKGAELTTAGMQRLVSDYKSKTAMIYLNDKEDISKFITKINRTYEAQGIQVNNNQETMDKMMESFSNAIRIIAIGCIIITAVIAVFIILLIVRVRVLKERMRMGVSKALGYTSNQLIGHLVMSLLPVIVLSSVIGAIAGFYGTNPIMALSLASNGIVRCSFYVMKSLVIITPIGISVIGLITILAVSKGIRKISPSAMFEQANS